MRAPATVENFVGKVLHKLPWSALAKLRAVSQGVKRQICVRPDSLTFDDLTNFMECDDAELVWTQQVWNEILRKRRVQERVGVFAKVKNSARNFSVADISETGRTGKMGGFQSGDGRLTNDGKIEDTVDGKDRVKKRIQFRTPPPRRKLQNRLPIKSKTAKKKSSRRTSMEDQLQLFRADSLHSSSRSPSKRVVKLDVSAGSGTISESKKALYGDNLFPVIIYGIHSSMTPEDLHCIFARYCPSVRYCQIYRGTQCLPSPGLPLKMIACSAR